jgi:hypothetical protein
MLLVAPFLKIDLGAGRQETLPGLLEIGARVFEIHGRSVGVLARIAARIEAANPFPLIDIERHTWADGDRAYVNVTEIDVPAVRVSGVSAAGQFHLGSLAAREGYGLPSQLL